MRTMFMNNYSKNEIVLIKYPFSDLTTFKVRPAVIVGVDNILFDLFITPLTSKTNNLIPGEFVLENYLESGLFVETAIKRGLYTIDRRLVIKKVGFISNNDAIKLDHSIRLWLEIE